MVNKGGIPMRLFISKLKFLYASIREYGFTNGYKFFSLFCAIEKDPQLYYHYIEHCEKIRNDYILLNDKESAEQCEKYLEEMRAKIEPVVANIIKHRAKAN
jgi:hypothetical protein